MCSFEGTAKRLCAFFYNIGDWSNGMIGVSKTFGGGSIPSSPVTKTSKIHKILACFIFLKINR